MKTVILAAIVAALLSGCTMASSSFLGTGTRCDKADLVHIAFISAAAVTPKITPDIKRGERALYAGVRAACNSGSDLKSADLAQIINGYVAALEEYQR